MSSQLHPSETQLAGLTGLYFWNLECIVEKVSVASSKPGHLALYGPSPALRLCCGCTGTACQGAHHKAVMMEMGSALWRMACSAFTCKSENTQKATSLNVGTHTSSWSIQYEWRNYPKKIDNCIHGPCLHIAWNCIPVLAPLLPWHSQFQCQITIPDTVKEDPCTMTVVQWYCPSHRKKCLWRQKCEHLHEQIQGANF